jgi:HSP20 family protein
MLYRKILGVPTFRWRGPFEEIDRMRRQIDARLDELRVGPYAQQFAGVFPLVNLTEDKDSLYIRAELPGVQADALDIQATGNSIAISGERKIAAENENAKYHRREREAGKFSRMMDLPGEIDSGKVTASLADGILTIVIPKAEKTKPKQITVT